MERNYGIRSAARHALTHPVDFIRGIRPSELQAQPRTGIKKPKVERVADQNLQREGIAQFDASRRTVLKGLGIGVGAVIVGGVGAWKAAEVFAPDPIDKYSGEREETKTLIAQWEDEIAKNPSKREQYVPEITGLATAFFAKQMGYDKNRFKNTIELMDQKKYDENYSDKDCIEKQATLAFSSTRSDKVYVSKDKPEFKSDPVRLLFSVVIHELHHVAPPLKDYPGLITSGSIQKVRYERGIQAYTQYVLPGTQRECLASLRYEIEEALVQDSTEKMTKPLGFVTKGHVYDAWMEIYNSSVLSLYGGDHKELLEFHQKSDAEGFMRSVGARLGGKTPQEQLQFGDSYLAKVFSGK